MSAWRSGARDAPLHGDCLSPVIIPVTGMTDQTLAWLAHLKHETDWPGTDYAPGFGFVGDPRQTRVADFVKLRHADLSVRCRKCQACLAFRSRLWTARAINECVLVNGRTWFGTLTAAPAVRFQWQVRASQSAMTRRREPWHDLDAQTKFKAICDVASAELTKWLKRIRKNSGARLRYLLVTEAHKDGSPHWHCLIHEAGGTVTKRVMEQAWRSGFSQFRLVDADKRAALYVCKYLAKSALARVRASQGYGRVNGHIPKAKPESDRREQEKDRSLSKEPVKGDKGPP